MAIGIAATLTLATPAFAQCEVGAWGAANTVKAQRRVKVQGMTAALNSAYTADVLTAKETLLLALEEMNTVIIGKLGSFWEEWHQAMEDMTAQLSATLVDRTRQTAENEDAKNVALAAKTQQKKELEAKETYEPASEAICRFDTINEDLNESDAISDALTVGYSMDFRNIGGNNKNSIARSGKAGLQKSRWEVYRDKFCDKESNNGRAGCSEDGPMANAHILPSKTIFGKPTIDLDDANTRDALRELTFNITGYEATDLIPVTAFKSFQGLEQRQENREYLAQMDAVGALVYSTVAERGMGDPAPEVKELRERMGVTDASETPSKREIRQSIVEQLRDPAYYIQLYANPKTVSQKELYLKAYNVTMLYDMIAKQEKISTVYAIQAANRLNKADRSRHNASSSAPLR